MSSNEFRIAVLPGDGIGGEVMEVCLHVLQAAAERVGGFSLACLEHPGGAAHYRETGTALPDASLRAADEADAILFGAMGLPDVRTAEGTEIAPQIDLRIHFDLYAGVRPIRTIEGGPLALAHPRAREIDFVLVRESTEGMFASWGKGQVTDDEARDTMVITRKGTARVCDFALKLAARRKQHGRPGRVTCVDKANVFASLAFFRRIFDERAAAFSGIAADHLYVDAAALDLVRRPWEFDVLVTENLFGDILSDLGAALIGGMGMAPSADIGEHHAVFQPCHGSAPDIAGTGKANPTAMILSGAMMLDWLGERSGAAAAVDAARLVENAVASAYRDAGVRPHDSGGADGTSEITQAVLTALKSGA